MTPPLRFRSLPRLGAMALLVALTLALGRPSHAGHDDFEFGRRLAAAKEFDYARQVFDRILADAGATDEHKDEARYGLALLMKEQAITTAGRPDVSLEEVEKLFSQAAGDIETFVQKNPNSPYTTQARLDVGTIRLAFVQWAHELLEDPDEIAERGYSPSAVREAASANVRKAMDYFKALRPEPSDLNPKEHQQLAEYYWVISQYYAALVEEPCSTGAIAALSRASTALDDYVMMHEGQLLSIYAMDILGLVWWERAKCEQDEAEKTSHYSNAFMWFEACIATPNDGPDHERVITNGYYHIAQVGLDAGRREERNFARDALNHLEGMLENHPVAWRTDSGLRAMVEHSKIECQRGNAGRAVEIAQQAGEYAKQSGKPYLERAANRQLNRYVSGACGGSIGGLAPDVLMRVAEDLFAQQKFPEAIRAYRSVIDATPKTRSGFMTYGWDAWERISSAYQRMDDLLGAALALEPIHDAWKNGVIPADETDENGTNVLLEKAAQARKRTLQLLRVFLEGVDMPAAAALQKQIQSTIANDYESPVVDDILFFNAVQKFNAANEAREQRKPGWERLFDEARQGFQQVAANPDDNNQERAWVYLARIPSILDNYGKVIEVVDEALATWEKKEFKDQAERYDTVRNRRDVARSQLLYWKGDAYAKLDQPAKVVETLDDYLARFPGAAKPYPKSFALSTLISAVLDQGDIEKADGLFRRLLQEDPAFPFLAGITFKFANHYDQQRQELEKDLVEVKKRLNEVKPKLREAEREFHRLTLGITDTDKLIRQYEEALALHEKNEALRRAGQRPDQPVDPVLLGKAREEEKDGALAKKKADMEKQLETVSADREKYGTEYEALNTRRHELEQAIYEPLTKAGAYWKDWDAVLKTLQEKGEDVKRDAGNLRAFGRIFHTAARLRPDVLSNWQDARGFYEDYLADKQVERLPTENEDKRQAIAALGDIYVNLASREGDAAERRRMVTRAVDLLQTAVAKSPSDTQLVVNMLANKVIVLQWQDRSVTPPTTWRFALPAVGTVRELREAARDLTKKDNPYRPAFEDPQEERTWDGALGKFLRQLQMEDDRKVEAWLPKEGGSPFNASLYRDLANTSTDLRLAMSWAYAKTGRDEDVPKAQNILLTFLRRGPLAAEEDSPEFWEANQVLMTLYLDTGERWSQDPTTSRDGAAMLDRAADLLKRLYAYYPKFGDEVVDGNERKWRDMLGRLNQLRSAARMPRVTLAVASQPSLAPANDANTEEVR